MTDEQALLAAIRANPADDLPRLVYADFVEERGDADRATLIRLGCEMEAEQPDFRIDTAMNADVYEMSADPRVAACYAALCRLVRRGVLEQTGFLPGGWWRHGYVVRRGFVHTLRGDLSELRAHLPAVLAREMVRAVEVVDREPWGNWTFTGADTAPFGWERGYAGSWHYRSPYVLPPDVWDRLPLPVTTPGPYPPPVKASPSHSAAVAALAADVLAEAVAAAGV